MNTLRRPSSRTPGRPKKSENPDVQNVKETILLNAKQLFMKKGFSGVSITDIVQSVGITKPTLYHYFPDKQALYAGVLCHSFARGGHYIQNGIRTKETLRDKLLTLATGFFKNSPTSLTLMIRDAKENLDEANVKIVYDSFHKEILTPFIEMLEIAKRNGEVKKHDSLVMAHLLIGLMDSLVISYTMEFSRNFNYPKTAENLIDSFMDGITLAPKI